MKKQYNALIVDDERLSRKELISMLADFEYIKVIGEAENVISASKAIEEFKPDIVFLDIQMPGESGFDLFDKTDIRGKVIFVTAYDEYAFRAFEVNAFDYLLKPVNPERLRSTLERLELPAKEAQVKELKYDDRLFLMLNTHMKFIKISSLLSISAAGDYSEIITREGQKGLVHKSMNEWEERLPENYFCRIHRSTIINLEYIEKIEEWFNHSFRVFLKGADSPYIMSRRYASKIREKFG